MHPTKPRTWFARFARATSRASGRAITFVAAVAVGWLALVTLLPLPSPRPG